MTDWNKGLDTEIEPQPQNAGDPQQQLDAANQRLLDYESEIAAVCPEDLSLKETFNAITVRAEAAERKLATALEALQNIKRHQEVVAGDSLPKRGATWLIADKALAQIEQPQQQLPGEDPPFDMCQCPACVALRTRSEPHA